MKSIKNSVQELSPWQCRQAAMLYHYSSVEYLKELHKKVTYLLDGVLDPALDLASEQGRDAVLADPRWGNRNTSQNWSNNAWPILKDLQSSLARDIGMRAFGTFAVTSAGSTLRGVDEYSMAWATDAEEEHYLAATSAITRHATLIDLTLDPYPDPRWNDFAYAAAFPQFLTECQEIPSFRINFDIILDTGSIPDRTGVYVSAEDPDAALQFVWSGSNPCPLRTAATFNELGKHALELVGRSKLWFDEDAMLQFATRTEYRAVFEDRIMYDGRLDPELAPSAVALESFTCRPSKWYLVEIVAEYGEPAHLTWSLNRTSEVVLRLEGGESCPEAGHYFSPAQLDSRRHFEVGDEMPKLDGEYGHTIWQWDPNQTK